MASELPNLFADGIAPVRRSRADEVFFIRMEASPQTGSDEAEEFGGGFVNCYVDAEDLRTAELRAIDLIEGNGWQLERFVTWKLTCAECAADQQPEDDDSSARELIQQAKAQGEACIFYCWPVDAPDANDPDA